MKVKYATQIFSHSVVAGIKTIYDLNNFSDSVKSKVPATWMFFEKLNKLFDILNSKHMFDGNEFKSGLKINKNTASYKFLEEMATYLQDIKLVNRKKVFSFDGIVQTINGILFLLKSLMNDSTNIQYLLTSRLNQDALENTFALIRSANGNNTHPSVQEFNFTVAKLLSIKFLTPFTTLSNCEDDSDYKLLDIIREEIQEESNKIEVNQPGISNDSRDKYFTSICDVSDSDTDEPAVDNNLESLPYIKNSDASTRYFVGYLIQRVLKKFNCVNCALTLVKENDYLECNSELLIKYRNYMNDTFGKLQTPSQTFFELCSRQINQFEAFFKRNAHIIGVKQDIVNILQANDQEFYNKFDLCFEHRMFLLNLMILILLRKHSKWHMESIKNEQRGQAKVGSINKQTRNRWNSTLN